MRLKTFTAIVHGVCQEIGEAKRYTVRIECPAHRVDTVDGGLKTALRFVFGIDRRGYPCLACLRDRLLGYDNGEIAKLAADRIHGLGHARSGECFQSHRRPALNRFHGFDPRLGVDFVLR